MSCMANCIISRVPIKMSIILNRTESLENCRCRTAYHTVHQPNIIIIPDDENIVPDDNYCFVYTYRYIKIYENKQIRTAGPNDNWNYFRLANRETNVVTVTDAVNSIITARITGGGVMVTLRWRRTVILSRPVIKICRRVFWFLFPCNSVFSTTHVRGSPRHDLLSGIVGITTTTSAQ